MFHVKPSGLSGGQLGLGRRTDKATVEALSATAHCATGNFRSTPSRKTHTRDNHGNLATVNEIPLFLLGCGGSRFCHQRWACLAQQVIGVLAPALHTGLGRGDAEVRINGVHPWPREGAGAARDQYYRSAPTSSRGGPIDSGTNPKFTCTRPIHEAIQSGEHLSYRPPTC